MASYPAQHSVLVIEPKNVAGEDIALLTMEKNPMDALKYFISIDDNPPRFQSNIYEQKIENIPGLVSSEELDDANDAVFAKYASSKFYFFNLLKNTAWAASIFGKGNDSIVNYVANGKINGVLSSNKKYTLVIPDAKFQGYLQERQKMATIPSTSVHKVNISSRKNVQDKILAVIKSGIVGGKGDSINAEIVFPHLLSAYPNENWTRAKINSALGTLVRHGDLVRVCVLDKNGSPTKSFAQGKFHINTRTALDHAAIQQQVHVAAPVAAVAIPAVSPVINPAPDNFALSGHRSRREAVAAARLAVEDYIRNNMVNGHLVFTTEEIQRKNLSITKRKITNALNNVKRQGFAAKLIRCIKTGLWEYRNNHRIPWSKEHSIKEHSIKNSSENSVAIGDLVKNMSILAEALLKQQRV